jgi:hypothetical protein
MDPKSPLASRTVWFNILTLVAGVAAYVAGSDVMAEYPAVVPVFAAVAGAVNIVLRFLTSKPIM